MSGTHHRRREIGATAIEYALLAGTLSLAAIIISGLVASLTGVFVDIADFFNTII